MKTHLKIKAKSLAEEGRIIRLEERKQGPRHKLVEYRRPSGKVVLKRIKVHDGHPDVRQSLREHRIRVVRPEARATHLAYGFLRGLGYRQVEKTVREDNEPNWSRVVQLVSKYGDMDKRVAAQELAEWSEA